LDKKIKADKDKEWWKTFIRNGKKITRTTVKAAAATGVVVLGSLIAKQAMQHRMGEHPNKESSQRTVTNGDKKGDPPNSRELLQRIVTKGYEICRKLPQQCEKTKVEANVDWLNEFLKTNDTIYTNDQRKTYRETTLAKLCEYCEYCAESTPNESSSDDNSRKILEELSGRIFTVRTNLKDHASD
jgi:hypothetical protein